MRIFRLVAFEEGHSITLDPTTAMFGRVATTYVVTAIDKGRSRLVVKLEFKVSPHGLGSTLRRQVLPPGDLIMMRKQLRTLKKLAERDATCLRNAGVG
jgi:hypothetical protein